MVQPTCENPTGSIELRLSGPSAPYSVQWGDSGSAELRRDNLFPGRYSAIITDVKGCMVPLEFIIVEPYRFSVMLPGDITMCRGQYRDIVAQCDEAEVSYRWYFNGGELPDSREPLIKQFLVTPNPTTGYFKVHIELYRSSDFTIKLYSPSGVLIDEKYGENLQSKTFELEQ